MLSDSKKLALVLALFFVILDLLAAAPAAGEELQVSAKAAILMDRDSGRVLWRKNEHQRLPMASVTKIMTAIIALEEGREEDLVTVSKEAAQTGGSSIWLEEGEKKTLEELVYGLMLRSGNDAAVAIAEHLAGSVKKFSFLMNRKAREIGAMNTNFINPHGLPDEEHYSTAYDLGLISVYAMQNPRFREIVATPGRTISWPGQPWERYLGNQNRLLEIYPGGDGIKTGWTTAAGRCFAGSATRDGWQLVTVVLNAPQMWEDAMLLLDYGFNTFKREKMLERGRPVITARVNRGRAAKVSLVPGRDGYLPLQEGEKERVRCRFQIQESYDAPLKKGEKLGEVQLFLDDEQLGTVDLLAGEDVPRISFLEQLRRLWVSILM
ncbi:MAG TPA: D-alanyl-D-alanine carboxypeptidase family protein [Bacillota bacterium]|jgi:D-alanyl-D-alanine carboxypeptidase (penicillin-binding protein 5/6)|nr:D-alanyl-D-alanine carboxypeptidase [Bacillota bacterium]HOB87194.1 D-alanyl-D-alanine carboxypeptidase family protein [Bacillota bacterium]HOP69226.1 D-alanyl-D-alanine carboxypeptidase family protein [Bacillota bacterium]HPT34254.1 D-alanyl-D-alanine carboxypeptidase family protein [Bacillota bacterium]HPZ64234.1 D-alanyl-D-alanine carboxypeptidase family protein [Bacillota bacterium]